MAVNGCVPPALTVARSGVTRMEVSAPATTSTTAVPEVLPTVAVTSRPLATWVWAVSRPPLLIVPALVDQFGLMGTGLPYWSRPLAVNGCVPPALTVAGSGVTRMEVGGPATTSTTAVPEVLPTVAVTSRPLATWGWAVSRPPPLIVPALVDQFGLMGTGLPYWSQPMAVNGCVPPALTVAGSGVTRMEVGGPATTSTTALPEMLPAVAGTSRPRETWGWG